MLEGTLQLKNCWFAIHFPLIATLCSSVIPLPSIPWGPIGTARFVMVCWVSRRVPSALQSGDEYFSTYTNYRPSFLSTSIPISLALERPRCCDHGRTLTTCAAKNFRDTLTKTLFWIVLWCCFKTWSTCTPTVSLDTCIGLSDCFHQDLAMVAHRITSVWQCCLAEYTWTRKLKHYWIFGPDLQGRPTAKHGKPSLAWIYIGKL